MGVVGVCLGARRGGKGGQQGWADKCTGPPRGLSWEEGGGGRKRDDLACVPAANRPGGSGRRGTRWDWPVRELGAPGGHPSQKGTKSGRGAGGSTPTPPGGPHQHPRASTPRNFRKHLRMVGSRRVKAQSKAQSKADGWGALLLADWGLACCSLRPQGGYPPRAPSHPQTPPKGQGPAPSRRLRPAPPRRVAAASCTLQTPLACVLPSPRPQLPRVAAGRVPNGLCSHCSVRRAARAELQPVLERPHPHESRHLSRLPRQ